MIKRLCFAAALALMLAAALPISSQQQQEQGMNCPMHQKHQADKAGATDEHDGARHTAEMNRRGDQAMGFSQATTTHHFLLKRDGGSIEVEANEASDQTGRDQIRQHLAHIAEMFAAGDFNTPIFIHAETPPGVPVMQRLKSEIKYEFEKTERGGRVRIQTRNPEALAAIHRFLRFQIKEHQTGDPLEVD